MATFDQDSLFSLEVVVDKIHLSKVTCRFPAVAFRLLDFPTLLIYHVEPDLGEAIKRNIKRDPFYTMPPQLTELQDRHGQYLVKKGKSCLLKVSPSMLLSHLQNTPLYVMIIDSFPEVPKLIGNCAIPMDATMEAVCNDISEMGISVPSSHGEKGTFRISNLMGEEIGQISLGFRILSLGVGLLPHIPDKSIAKMGQGSMISHPKIKRKVAAEMASMPKPMEQEATDIILEDLEAADKNIQVVMSTPSPQREMMHTQTQVEAGRVAATQTEQKRKKKKVQQVMQTDHPMTHYDKELDDLFITNVVVPPPLFYNSALDPPQLAPGLTFDDYLAHKQREQIQQELSDSDDSDSTIRHEDKFSDSDLEISKPTPPPVQKKTMATKPGKGKQRSTTANKVGNALGALSQFPLLSAIMSEIVSLQGVGGSEDQAQFTIAHPPKAFSPRRGTTPRTPRTVSPTVRIISPRSAALKPDATLGLSSPGRRKQPPAAKPVPKGKSWLKKETKQLQKPQLLMAVPKTKLTPGMTNTQRLRLAKTNPQLLQKLEKEEKERVERFKARRRELGEGFEVSPLDVSTEIRKHPAESSIGQYGRHPVPKLDLHDHHKKPVPTPRMSLTGEQFLEHITVSEAPPIIPRAFRKDKRHERAWEEEPAFTYPAKPSSDENSHSHSHSVRSHIDVHVSAISLHEEDEDTSAAHSDVSYDDDKVPELGKTKTFSNPGFPKRTRTESAHSTDNLSIQYSDDFEDSPNHIIDGQSEEDEDNNQHQVTASEGLDPSELLGLKKMVDTYSDEGSSHASGDHSLQGLEIMGLRQIVDKYSDDDEPSKASSTQSFHSVESGHSEPKPKLKLSTSTVKTVAPSTSDMSPVVAVRQSSMSLRNGISSMEDEVNLDESYDSTAYIHRSEMASQYSSIESTGPGGMQWHNQKRPLPSPRKSLDHVPKLLPPQEEYSDNFESSESESDIENIKQMKDANVAPEARFGYTWAGY